MAIEPHRIEAAARWYWDHEVLGGGTEFDDLDAERREAVMETIGRILCKGYPELAAGTAWVAPVEVTETGNVGVSIIDFGILPDAHTKDRTRDAHLSKGKDGDR